LHGRLRSDESTKLYVALVRGDLRQKFKSAAGTEDGGNIDLSVSGEGNVIGSCANIPNVVDDVTDSKDSVASHHYASEYKSKITVNLPIKIDGIEKEAQTEFYFLSSMNIDDEDEDDTGTDLMSRSRYPFCSVNPKRVERIKYVVMQ